MDKQPDKLDVLMDWFLGDAKEINEAQKKMLEKQTALLERVEELNKFIDYKIEKSMREDIIGMSASCNDEAKYKTKRCLFIAIIFLCSVLSALIGVKLTLFIIK